MKFLCELLTEVFRGSGRDTTAASQWRDEIVDRHTPVTSETENDWWVVTPAGRKYGPFPTYDRALSFYKNRKDVDRKSQLKAVRKGGRI